MHFNSELLFHTLRRYLLNSEIIKDLKDPSDEVCDGIYMDWVLYKCACHSVNNNYNDAVGVDNTTKE